MLSSLTVRRCLYVFFVLLAVLPLVIGVPDWVKPDRMPWEHAGAVDWLRSRLFFFFLFGPAVAIALDYVFVDSYDDGAKRFFGRLAALCALVAVASLALH